MKEAQAELLAKGVRFSPNPEAERLEKSLGIEFSEEPAKIVLSLRNRIALLRARPSLSGKIAGVITTVLKRERAGSYKLKFNAYLCGESEDPFTGFHENIHGFVAQTNPSIPQAREDLTQAVREATYSRPVPNIDVEESVVFQCFNEGIATYGAIETALKDERYNRGDLVGLQNLLLSGDDSNKESVRIDPGFIDQEFSQVRGVINTYQSALERRGGRVLQSVFKAEQALDDPKYSIGYFFTHRAMDSLQTAGLETGEALTSLVKNPPRRLAELRNPGSQSEIILQARTKA